MDAMLASPRLGFSATVTSTPNAKRDLHGCRYPSFFVPPSPSQDDASELPSIVVEDLTLVSHDDSTRTVLSSPRMPVWNAFPASALSFLSTRTGAAYTTVAPKKTSGKNLMKILRKRRW